LLLDLLPGEVLLEPGDAGPLHHLEGALLLPVFDLALEEGVDAERIDVGVGQRAPSDGGVGRRGRRGRRWRRGRWAAGRGGEQWSGGKGRERERPEDEAAPGPEQARAAHRTSCRSRQSPRAPRGSPRPLLMTDD